MTQDSPQHTVQELIEGQRIALLSTIHRNGNLVTRPMACQDTEFDGRLWFFAESDSDKCEEVRIDPRVNVTFAQEGSWVSLSGHAEVVRDPERARELWNPFAESWFQCEPEDPRVALIRVDARSAEYWDTPGKVGQVIGMVKAKATDERPDLGANETVEL